MKKDIGIVMILCGILFAVTFDNVGWHWLIGDIGLSWQHLFMITGIAGAVLTVVPEKK